MGCWNGTCFLTRLPIFVGQPVKLFFIAQNTDGYRNTVHPDGWWKPIALPFSGRYDDYGRIEDTEHDKHAVWMLAAAKFRVKSGDDMKPFDAARLSGPDWEAALQDLVEAANQCGLEAEILDGMRKPYWAPVAVQMAHTWAWRHVADSNIVSDREYLGSTAMRLSVAGPLREALVQMDPVWGKDFEDARPKILKAHAVEIASLMAGMEAMRMAFGPACGSGSQDGMCEPWQTEFYKLMFVAAAALPRRYDEYPQAPFSAAVAWDGNFLETDMNNEPDQAVDVPAGCDPDDLYKTILQAGVDNILSAMEEAGQADGDGGYDEET